jgi:hypothetical protein
VPEAAALGIRARGSGLRRVDVTTALVGERSIVRTWLMRGTLHLVAADDTRWLLALLGPIFASANRTRHAQLGLDDDLKARGVRALRRILADSGPLTRYQLVERLRALNIRLDPKTQAPIHLLGFAALSGVCCLGPDRPNGEPTYVLLDDWVPKRRSTPMPAVGQLARRYFSAFGPATLEDFVSWSGLPVARARAALADVRPALEEVAIRGQAAFLPKGRLREWLGHEPAKPSVRLLPAFDTYLLGYRRRELAVSPDLQRRLQRGGGWLHPAVIREGRAIGIWKLRQGGRERRVVIELEEPATATLRREIEREVADLCRFLGEPAGLALS